jgi:hypothetical protein
MPPKSILHREVGTHDPSANVPKVNRSAHKWTKADLGLLGVSYQYDVFDDIRIGIEDADMPSELLEGDKSNQYRLICSHTKICSKDRSD